MATNREIVTQYREEMVGKVVEALQRGTAPWQRPWDSDYAPPQNAVSGRRYNGINIIILSIMGLKMDGGSDPRWCTFNQARAKGWKIKKGAKGTRISFWKNLATPLEDENDEPILDENGSPVVRSFLMQKLFNVFHASQVEGIPAYVPPFINVIEANRKAERILSDSGADIRHGGCRAFYSPSGDFIQLPVKESFYNAASYYASVFHELSHWTGAGSRLARDMSGGKMSTSRAREELVAEISSMFLSAETGIPQTEERIENHAAYVESWIELLTSDSNALFKAAADANRATDFLLRKEREREKLEAENSDIDDAA